MRTNASGGRNSAVLRGFTIIELVIAITILAVLAGAAVPLASIAFQSKAKRATRDELATLSAAVVDYFRDVGGLPASAGDLYSDPGLGGWHGPYLYTTSQDLLSGASDNEVDAWSTPFTFAASGSSVLALSSAGPDRVSGNTDDLSIQVDVTPIRRELTLDELQTLNDAITSYNATHLPSSPLSTNLDALLDSLVADGYLPSKQSYQTDAWGDAYVSDPYGISPVVKLGSTHLGAAASGSGAGKGKGGGKGGGKGK